MDWLLYKNTYWNYFEQLEKDFFDTSIYCEIDDCNKSSYSIKYLQALLSICGEIDTIFKTFCKKLDLSLDIDTCGIDDYIRVIKQSYPTFAMEKVVLVGYKYSELVPWKSIDKNFPPNFWKIYNKVKHHRDSASNGKENYKYANQKTVLEALSALYVLEQYWVAYNFIDEGIKENTIIPRFKSKKLSLTNWKFYSTYFNVPTEYLITDAYLTYIKG